MASGATSLPRSSTRQPVALQQNLHNVLADVVDIPLHGGQENLGGSAVLSRGEVLLQHLKSRLGRFRAHEKLGQEEGSLLKPFAHLVQGRHQLPIDDVQNRLAALR